MKKIAILGSTGSIGTQTLEVIRENKDIEVTGLAAGTNVDLLEKQIREAATLVAVEDLYRPYKPKRRTRAMIAREKGLESLANVILLQNLKEPVEKAAEAYISVEKGVESVQDAINGAMDILAEGISDDAKYRTYIRNITMNKGLLQSTAKDGEQKSVYETYYNYEEPVKKAANYITLSNEEDGVAEAIDKFCSQQ